MAETDTIRKKKGPGKIRRTLQIVNRNFRSFFWFEFFYKAVTFTLFTPLLRELVSLVLYANGISNLTNYNFLHFLYNPLTWILLIGILYLVGAFIAIEFAGLINGIHAPKELIEKRVPQQECEIQAIEDNANHWLQDGLKEHEEGRSHQSGLPD